MIVQGEAKVSTSVRLGMLTPSSNTVLEPMTAAMLSGVPDVTAHFSRFKVTEITISESSDRQFAEDEILRAAELLTHAKVDVIAWNGTSASWLGFERDEQLCERIIAATGVAACTSVLAFREIFERTGVSRVGLVTPYVSAVQTRIVETWGRSGILCTAERHCGLDDNFAFAEVSEGDIAEMARAVARTGVDAVAIVCTNMRGAGLAEKLETELGLPVYDSIATTLWKSLLLADVAPARIRGWGSLFSNPLLGPAGAAASEDLKPQPDGRQPRFVTSDPIANRQYQGISSFGE
jgi:maleate isomerase